MEVSRIIAEIDAQISKLEQAKALLQGVSVPQGRSKKSTNGAAASAATKGVTRKRRNLSPEARKRIAEAQKRRWAERRGQS